MRFFSSSAGNLYDDVSSIDSNSYKNHKSKDRLCDKPRDTPREIPRMISFATQPDMNSKYSYSIQQNSTQKREILPSRCGSEYSNANRIRIPPSRRSTKGEIFSRSMSVVTKDTNATACSSTYIDRAKVFKERRYLSKSTGPPKNQVITELVGTGKLSTAQNRTIKRRSEDMNQKQLDMKSKTFYNECFLRGITSKEAEVAARDVEEQYNKWWVNTTHKSNSGNTEDEAATPSSVCSSDSSLRGLPGSSTSTENSDTLRYQQHLHGSQEFSTINEQTRLLVQVMLDTGGDTKNPLFLKYLDVLHSHYKASGHDVRWGQNQTQEGLHASRIDGTWHTISKPTYTECHGKNDSNESLYTLGRMSFDVFKPKNLVCSLQATWNVVDLPGKHINDPNRPRTVPRSLLIDAKKAATTIRNYDICVDFTIEPHQTRTGRKVQKEATSDCAEYVVKEPIRCSMMNYGYCMPDPDTPNRLTVWFSGGSLNIHDECKEDIEEWKKIFDDSNDNANDFEDVLGTAKRLAAKFMLGLVVSNEIHSDGAIKYVLKKPIGGHGAVFLDILYADDNLRIMKGQNGCIYVLIRDDMTA